MFGWIALMALVALASIGALIYLFTRFRRFNFVYRLSQKHKALKWILPLCMLLILAGITFFILRNVTYKPLNAAIVLIHLVLFWLIFDLIGRLVHGKFAHGKRVYWQGIAAIVACAAYLGYGWYMAHHVVRTDYALKSDKLTKSVRIAQISDSHVGATFHGEEFKEYMLWINEAEPDIVVITGDYVDDDTTKEDMLLCGEALSTLDAPVYFIYGNHDRGYFNTREFTSDELYKNLIDNGVNVLRDESVYLEEYNLTLVGREDRSAAQMSSNGRMSMEQLMKDVDMDSHIVVLDHEPNAYDEETEAGADLVLCGHTHGGQLFPCGYIGLLFGSNDEFYGLSQIQNTTFIVNSGISDWSIPFKTGCKAEYVIIDIEAGR